MCIHRHMLTMLIGLGANSNGSIYLGTRKICFHWYLQEQMSSEWVGDVGSASVSNHAEWLREYAERDPTASMAWYSCIVLHIQGKEPPDISCHILFHFPRLRLRKVYALGTYIITSIAMIRAQKQKQARKMT